MKSRRPEKLNVDQVALIEAKGIVLHPITATLLHAELIKMENGSKVCRLPSTILEYYNYNLQQKLKSYVNTNKSSIVGRN